MVIIKIREKGMAYTSSLIPYSSNCPEMWQFLALMREDFLTEGWIKAKCPQACAMATCIHVTTVSIDMHTQSLNGQTNRPVPTPSNQCLLAVVMTQHKLGEMGWNNYSNAKKDSKSSTLSTLTCEQNLKFKFNGFTS